MVTSMKKPKKGWGGKRKNAGRKKILVPCPWCRKKCGVRELMAVHKPRCLKRPRRAHGPRSNRK